MVAVLVGHDIERIVEERRRLGTDKLDELWEGTWHFVNPPKSWHNDLNEDLRDVLKPLALLRGLRGRGDGMGIFADDESWRIPDQSYATPESVFEDGLTSAELVVEFRSPGDESYLKLPFYGLRGVREALIVHRNRTFELYRLHADGTHEVEPSGRSEVLGVTFSTVEGPKLRVTWDGGEAEV